jgi:hypothetical protein
VDGSRDSPDQQFDSQALPESMAMKAMKTKRMSSASAQFHKGSLTPPAAECQTDEASSAPSVEERVALSAEEEKKMGVSQY